jgi:hypothetical protein
MPRHAISFAMPRPDCDVSHTDELYAQVRLVGRTAAWQSCYLL